MRVARAAPEGSRPVIILNAAPAPKIGSHPKSSGILVD
jgi:hypothetical protein